MSLVDVYKWIKKYVRLMENYLEQIKPNVVEVWRTDELFLKVTHHEIPLCLNGKDETRF